MTPQRCDCDIGECQGGSSQPDCASFLARSSPLQAEWCHYCGEHTWHQNETCLKIPIAQTHV